MSLPHSAGHFDRMHHRPSTDLPPLEDEAAMTGETVHVIRLTERQIEAIIIAAISREGAKERPLEALSPQSQQIVRNIKFALIKQSTLL